MLCGFTNFFPVAVSAFSKGEFGEENTNDKGRVMFTDKYWSTRSYYDKNGLEVSKL